MCGIVATKDLDDARCCNAPMRSLTSDHYYRISHWTKQRRLDWLASGGADRGPEDPRETAVAFLRQFNCPTCRASFAAVAASDFTRGHQSKYRCPPPHPTCWQTNCPQCDEWINLAVRFDKVWPDGGGPEPVRRQTSHGR